MTERSRREARRAIGGRWLLAVALAGAALAAGTVHTVVLCIVTVALTGAMALTWWNDEQTRFGTRRSATLLLVTGILLTAYSALQCLPVPIGWLASVAPHTADVWSRALRPLNESGPRWASISLDPTATRVEVLKGVSYLLAFVTALRIAHTRRGVSFLGGALVAIGTALALMALLHPAFGAKKLYGVFEPSVAVLTYDRHVAPFLNPNNLAAYLNVAFCLALAASLAPQPRLPRAIPAAAALFLATTQVWVASRGGVATMVLGAVLVVIMVRAPRARRQRSVATESVVAGLALMAGAVAIVLSSSNDAASELFDTDRSKFALFRQAVRMIPAFPIFGAGRGAFESTFPAFRDSPGVWTFTHPESVVAQWTIEWGVPVGIAGLLSIAIGLRPSTVLARSSTSAGAWAAITAVAVQNLVDLGSEVPGLVLAPVVCAAIVVGGTAGRESRWRVESWGKSPRMVAIAGIAVAACALLAAIPCIGTELSDERASLYEEAMPRRTPPAQLHGLARAAILRHPAEPYLPFILGWRASQSGDDDTVAWIEATLERANVYAPAHLALARLLARRLPSQARLEYRLATEQGLAIPMTVGSELTRLVAGYYDAMELVPPGQAGVATLQFLVEALSMRLPATSERLDVELATRASTDPGPSLRAAAAAVDDLEAGASSPWCDGLLREQCVRHAIEAAHDAEKIAPTLCDPYVIGARARVAAGDAARGLAELADGASVTSEHVQCLQALATLADDVHDERRAVEALGKIAASGCSRDEDCAANLAWVAATEERRGNPRQALVFYRRAYARSEDDSTLESIARLAASAGLHTEAADGYERLARKHPESATWPRAAATERDAALRAASAL